MVESQFQFFSSFLSNFLHNHQCPRSSNNAFEPVQHAMCMQLSPRRSQPIRALSSQVEALKSSQDFTERSQSVTFHTKLTTNIRWIKTDDIGKFEAWLVPSIWSLYDIVKRCSFIGGRFVLKKYWYNFEAPGDLGKFVGWSVCPGAPSFKLAQFNATINYKPTASNLFTRANV